ncbi:ABC transporter permease subunit [Beduinella massiliensis]|uniref:ABC transporter permease subunit n=1 Tax=Beduinella massiliensis TaxID=1852363 RepID=UPI000C8656DD
MLRYALRRLITSLVTLFLVITLTFFLMQTVPGGPFLGENVNPEITARLLAKYGYDQPLLTQYVHYLRDLFVGDMGFSMVVKSGESVTSVIASHFPLSCRIGLIALLIAVLLGIPLGVLASMKHGSVFDRIFIFTSSLFVSVPSFIMTIALMLIFGVWLKLLPLAYLEGWKSYIMPVFGMAIYPMFNLGRLTRTTMLDVIGQDYIKTARAKGLSTFKIMFKHALRNAIIPVVTALGPIIAGILTGSFVVEKVFAINGIGKYFISSITARDYPLIMGTTIFFAALLIACNYVVDLLYGVIDPRIKM